MQVLERLGEAMERGGDLRGAENAYEAICQLEDIGRAKTAQVAFRAVLSLCLLKLKDVRTLGSSIDLLGAMVKAKAADGLLYGDFAELQRKAESLQTACKVRNL